MEFFNWFLNPIQNQYADFEGRATRQEFWMYILVYLVIFIPLYAVGIMVGLDLLVQLAALAIFVPSLAIGARRLHDTGLSGWFQLLGIIPFIGTIIMIILFARKGEAGENKYGLNPVANTPAPAAPVAEDDTPTPVAPTAAAQPESVSTPETNPESTPTEPAERV